MKKSMTFLNALILLLLVNSQINAQTPGYLWSTNTSGPGTERMYNGATDLAGNVYFTGNMNDNFTWEGIPVQDRGTAFSNAFIAKYAPNGGLNWALPIDGGTGFLNNAGSINVTPDNDLVFKVQFTGAAGDTLYIGTNMFIHPGGLYLNMIVKMDTLGKILWTKEFIDSTNNTFLTNMELAVDGAGNIYLAGIFLGASLQLDTITVQPIGSSASCFIAKADANGNFIWAKSFGDKSPNGNGQGLLLAVNNQNQPIVSSSWAGDTVFVGNLYAVNSHIGGGFFPPSDRYVAKFDANGNALYLATEGGPGFEGPARIIPTANGGTMCYSNTATDTVEIDEGGTTILPNTLLMTWYDGQGDFEKFESFAYSPANAIYEALIATDGTDFYQGFAYNTPTLTIGGTTLQNTGVLSDIALMKTDAQGNVIWVMNVGGPEDDFINGLSYSSVHGLLFSGSETNDTLVLGMDTIINSGQFTGEGFMAALNVNNISLAENHLTHSMSVYPNPAKNVLNIAFEDVTAQTARVTIIGLSGQVVLHTTVNSVENAQVDISSLAPGVYILELGIGNDYAVKKFIKE